MISPAYRSFRQPSTAVPPNRDPLTGLRNHQGLTAWLDALLSAPGGDGQAGALLLLDIDSFHVTNDLLGHQEGDDLLLRVATVLRRWADDRCVLARTGSNEFAAVLTAEASEDFLTVSLAVRSAISAECEPYSPQMSIGIAPFDCRQPPAVDELMKRAGAALREAKQDGGSLTVACDADARNGIDGAEWLVRTLGDDRLAVFSQPIVEVRTNEAARHELLLRAFDERGRVLMPSAFIPAAERFGLMAAIDRWVVARGLALAADGLRVSINLSAQSLADITPILQMVESSIREGMDPADVMFEITETAAIRDLRAGYRALRTLSALGCPLALDDFGAGFGCFSYLKHVPAQVVKIDREFIRDMSRNDTDVAITTMITRLARELGMETIAEGVEDRDTLSAVAAAGVNYAQGYLFGRPGPIAPSATRSLGPVEALAATARNASPASARPPD